MGEICKYETLLIKNNVSLQAENRFNEGNNFKFFKLLKSDLILQLEYRLLHY